MTTEPTPQDEPTPTPSDPATPPSDPSPPNSEIPPSQTATIDVNQAWDVLRSSLPEEQREFLKNNGHSEQSLSDILATYEQNRKFVGADKADLIRRPKADRETDPEAWKAFDAALGVVDSADKFEPYTPPEGLGENFKPLADTELKVIDEAIIGIGGPLATPEGRKAALDLYHTVAPQMDAALEAQYRADVEKGLADLKGEWGSAYAGRIEVARGVFDQVLPAEQAKELNAFIKDAGLDEHPAFLKFGHAIAEKLSEDGLPAARPGTGDMGMTKAQAEAKVAEIKANPAYTDANHPDHARLVREMDKASAVFYSGG